MLVNIHFQKWSKGIIADYDKTIVYKIRRASAPDIKGKGFGNEI